MIFSMGKRSRFFCFREMIVEEYKKVYKEESRGNLKKCDAKHVEKA